MKFNKKTLSCLFTISLISILHPVASFADPGGKVTLNRNLSKIYSDSLGAAYAVRLGDVKLAAHAYENVWKRDKTDEAAFEKAIYAYLSIGDIKNALRLSTDADFKDSVNANYIMAVDALIAGDFKRLDSLLANTDTIGSKGVYLRHMKAWSLLSNKKLDDAITIASKPSGIRNIDISANYSRALMYEYAGDYKNAEIAYETSFSSTNIYSSAVIAYADFLKARGNKDKALEILQKSINKTDNNDLINEAIDNINIVPKIKKYNSKLLKQYISNSLSIIATAELYNDSGTPLADLLNAYNIYPKNYPIGLSAASILIDYKEYDTASDILNKIPKNTVSGDHASNELNNILGKTNKALALKNYELNATQRPNNYNLITYAYALVENKEYKNAVTYFSKIINNLEADKKTEHDNLWLMYYTRGNIRVELKDIEGAISDYRKANELNPDDAEILNALGYTLVDYDKNLDEALDLLRNAARMASRNGNIIDSLGWALFKLGHFDEALDQLETAVGLEPNNATIIEHLGDAYWKTGRKIDAKLEWQKAFRIYEKQDEKDKVQAKIENGINSSDNRNL